MLASKPRRLELALLAVILAGGLLLRLVFFAASLPSGGAPFIRDETNYVGLAVPLSQGHGFVDKWIWLRPPGYPAFVALFTALGGGNLSVAALAQIILSLANIALIYSLVLEVFGTRDDVPPGKARAVGLVAAGLMAVNPHMVFYSNLLMVETLYMLATSIAIWALLRALRNWRAEGEPGRRTLALVALAGLAVGVGALIRSLLLTFVPFLLGWFWWVASSRLRGAGSGFGRQLRGTVLPLVLFLMVMFAAILPWTVRNYLRYDRFLLIETTGGYNLWIYNDPKVSPTEINKRLTDIANPVDRERYAAQQGMRAITSDLPAFASAAVERFVSAWPVDGFYEFRVFMRDKYPGTDCTYLDVFAFLGTAFYIGFGVLTIWGFALAPGRTLKALFFLMLLHYGLATMFSNQEFRFRLPLYPLASVYAGWALLDFGSWVMHFRILKSNPNSKIGARSGPSKSKIGAALVSLVFVAQCLIVTAPGAVNAVRYERRYLAGKTELERGNYSGALADFMAASGTDEVCACLYRDIGLAHAGLKEPDKERAAYIKAISIEEHDWRTRALLSDRLRTAGDPHAANPILQTRPEFRTEQQRWAWDNLPPPKDPQLDIGAADIGYVKDFQSAEVEPNPQGGEITYRWTTTHSYARMVVPPGSSGLRMVARWHSLAWPGKPDPNAAVRVLVDGRDVGTLTAHPGWEDASLDLPDLDQENAAVAVIELLAPVSRPPGGETRTLGVAVDSIRLERR